VDDRTSKLLISFTQLVRSDIDIMNSTLTLLSKIANKKELELDEETTLKLKSTMSKLKVVITMDMEVINTLIDMGGRAHAAKVRTESESLLQVAAPRSCGRSMPRMSRKGRIHRQWKY
jgi:hypothetical protein